jgi:hypothetical protein
VDSIDGTLSDCRGEASIRQRSLSSLSDVLGEVGSLGPPGTPVRTGGRRGFDRPQRTVHNGLDSLVDGIATEDDDRRVSGTSLYHVHLPELAQAGYIEWDRDDGTVRRGPANDEVAPVLELLGEHHERLPDGWL